MTVASLLSPLSVLATMLLAAPIPVRPIADAPKLVAELGQGKPLVLHFFASWCGACRVEFPKLRAELLKLPSQGVQVALVTIDRPEDERAAAKMLADYKLTALPTLLLDAPEPDPVAKAMGDAKWDGTLPATFVFDASGKLVKSFRGMAKPAALDLAVKSASAAPAANQR
ncbi:MAG TPA: TlpA disulfide reductase family protein [Myxococcales bacterium]|jgi:thiol-disulfide isomerase/thioredoxin|nr:TlpA disulfide reductase family protein [Myxococcales bacterium]